MAIMLLLLPVLLLQPVFLLLKLLWLRLGGIHIHCVSTVSVIGGWR